MVNTSPSLCDPRLVAACSTGAGRAIIIAEDTVLEITHRFCIHALKRGAVQRAGRTGLSVSVRQRIERSSLTLALHRAGWGRTCTGLVQPLCA